MRTIAGTGVAGYEIEGSGGLLATRTPVNNPVRHRGRSRRRPLLLRGGYGAHPENGSGDHTAHHDFRKWRSRVFGGWGPALAASFSAPHEIRFDRDGHLFVVERDAHVVRRVDAQTGLVSTVAGTGEAGFSGDGGPAVNAQLRQPHSIAFTANGDLLILRHRQPAGSSGEHGNRNDLDDLRHGGTRGDPGYGPLEGTPLRGPRSLDTDNEGNAYLVLREGNAVFRLDTGAGRLQRIAGTGERGFTGDGGPGSTATFNGPKGIAYSVSDHSLYIVDTENHAIRRLNLDSEMLDTVLGTGERGDGPDGDPIRCQLARPHGVFAHEGVLYVTDSENHRVRVLEGVL